MKILFLWTACLLAGCSCSLLPEARPEGRLTVLTWNVQNLFDDEYNGGEYPEFDPRKAWTRQDFWQRCASLAEVLKGAVDGGPDIVALQEVEGSRAVEVLRDRFLGGLGYEHLVVPPSSGESVRPVFLSRFPVARTAFHYPPSPDGSPVRPIVEAEWKLGSRSLVLLNNHWKSRVPDPRQTEPQRRSYALTLAHRLAELAAREDGPLVAVLGDFNASVELSRDFSAPCMKLRKDHDPVAADGPQPCLYLASARSRVSAQEGTLLDLWEEVPSGSPSGSYCYQSTWSKLDHVFIPEMTLRGAPWSIGGFHLVATPRQLDAQGRPRAWSPKDRQGVSDHLPLTFELREH